LDEWRKWIEGNYFPLTDITSKWDLLLKEDEFLDIFADYNDDSFKKNLESILSRETQKEKSSLKSFCDAILKPWDIKVVQSSPNKIQAETKESGILSYPILSYPILSYPILSYPILSYPILSYPILSYVSHSNSFYRLEAQS
jgi:hypothetical protein